MRNNQPVSGREQVYDKDSVLISHTDESGLITFVNDDFINVSGFAAEELIGQPHNMIRHPDMPSEIFRDTWATLKRGRPWSGIIKNRSKNGDHYWVRASMTPKPDGGYMSVRVRPGAAEIQAAENLHRQLRDDPSLRLHEGRLRRRGLVGGDAGAVEQHDGIFDLGREMTGVGGLCHPAGRLLVAFRHAAALPRQRRQRMERVGDAASRGDLEAADGLGLIGRLACRQQSEGEGPEQRRKTHSER